MAETFDPSGKFDRDGNLENKVDSGNAQDLPARRKSRLLSVHEIELILPLDSNIPVVRKYKQIAIAFVAASSMIAYGQSFSMSGIVLPYLQGMMGTNERFTITKEQGSWFASTFVMGSLTGAISGGFIGQKYGRKKAIIFDNACIIIGFLVIIFAPNLELMLVGRYLCGHSGSSLQVVLPSYISEISQPALRPLNCCMTSSLFAIGVSLMFIVGAFLHWTTSVSVLISIPILALVSVLLFCPESPVWLIMVDELPAARKVLMNLRGSEPVAEAEFSRVKTNLDEMAVVERQSRIDGPAPDSLQSGLKAVVVGRLRPLFRNLVDPLRDKAFLKPLVTVAVVLGIGTEWNGMVTITFYMVILLTDLKLPFDPFYVAAALSVYRASLGAISMLFSHKMKKRQLLIGGCLGNSLCLVGLATFAYFNSDGGVVERHPDFAGWIPLGFIAGMYFFSLIGIFPVAFSLQGELLPSYARSYGSSIVGLMDNISLALCIKAVPDMVAALGMHGMFYLCAAFNFSIMIFAYLFIPETYGRTLEEIERHYRGTEPPPPCSTKTRSQSIISFEPTYR